MRRELRARLNADGTLTLRDGRRHMAHVDAGAVAFGGAPLVEEVRWAAVRAGYPIPDRAWADDVVNAAFEEAGKRRK